MSKELDLVTKSLEKKYGQGVVFNMASAVIPGIPKVSYGLLPVDIASHGGAGKGRIIEIWGKESAGKTTLCCHLLASCQVDPEYIQEGRSALFVDVEQTFDLEYAKKLGVDADNLYVTQPNSGEQALEIAEAYIATGKISCCIIDSVASLVPEAELKGEMGQSHVGLQARLMSQALRKLTPIVHKTGTVLVFINQIRMKIGVMFGCFHYNARVLLADGTTEKIGKIVNQQLDVEVLTRLSDGSLGVRKIVDWHNNGKAKRFINYVVDYPHGSGKSFLPVGDDHIFMTPQGERRASELSVGDPVLVKSWSYLTDIQKSYALGMFLGDSSLRVNDAMNTASLRTKHGFKQNMYCNDKYDLFSSEFRGSLKCDKEGRNYWDSAPTSELAWLAKYKKDSALRYVDDELLSKIDLPAIAIWYLDDGTYGGSYRFWGKGKSSICAKKLDEKSKNLLADRFEALGLPRPSLTKTGFLWCGKKCWEFQKKIMPYVPKSMNYKLHPDLRNECGAGLLKDSRKPELCLIEAKIVDIYEKKINSRATNKFDITVEDGHSYFIDNVLVHNSPETTTGGEALKYYATHRIELRRSTSAANVTKDDQGQLASCPVVVKFVKNKLGPPFREAVIDLSLKGDGFDAIGSIVDLAAENGFIIKSGSWYEYRTPQRREFDIALAEFIHGSSDDHVEPTVEKFVEWLEDEENELAQMVIDFQACDEGRLSGSRSLKAALDKLAYNSNAGWRLQGKDAVVAHLKQDTALARALEDKLYNFYFPTNGDN